MIRRNKKTKSKIKRKNPDQEKFSEIVTTHISPIGNRFKVRVFIAGNKVTDVDEKFKDYDTAKIAADIAKSTVIKELKKAPKTRSNPEYKLNDSLSSALEKGMGLPETREDSFELGKLYGVQVALTDYCGILQYLDRRRIKKSIEKEIHKSLAGLAKRVEIRGQGIEGPIPIIKRVQKT